MRELVNYEVIRSQPVGRFDYTMNCKATWGDGRTSWYSGGSNPGTAVYGLYCVVRDMAPLHLTRLGERTAWADAHMAGKRVGAEYANEFQD